jgi:hypothetical protein
MGAEALGDHQQEARSTHDHGRGDGDEVGQQGGGEQQFDKSIAEMRSDHHAVGKPDEETIAGLWKRPDASEETPRTARAYNLFGFGSSASRASHKPPR